MKFSRAIALMGCFTALLALCACPETTPPPAAVDATATQCKPGLAQIGVGDGFLEYLCGCTGSPAGGTILTAPASLTCHVPSGTIVMFQYVDIHTEHQIVNSSGLSFSSGQPIIPLGGIYTTAAQFIDSGTYGFEDAFDTALQGQIIVP